MLHKIKDLVGKDIAGMRVDLRSRNADGTLKYHEEIHGSFPVIAPLKSVEIRMEKIGSRDKEKSPWLYWTWETNNITDGNGLNRSYGCGYSGTARNMDDYYLEESTP